VDFDDEGMARFFVMGMGAAVRVLEPEGFREWVARESREVAAGLMPQ